MQGSGWPRTSEGAGLTGSVPLLAQFLIDPKGVIRAKWKEQDGTMDNVKTPAHTQQILAALAELKK